MNFRPSVLRIAPYHPGKKLPGVLKLSSNENPLGPSPRAMEAFRQAASTLHVYPEGSGADLRTDLARRHGLSEDQIILGHGSDEVLGFSAAVMIEPGDIAVTAKETFSQYRFSVELFGGSVVEVPLVDGFFDLPGILDSAAGRAKIIYLCNPNNPTGTWHSHDRIREFLRSVSPKVLVVLDEAYAEYADHEHFPRSSELIREFPNLLVTRTFSKIFGLAGLRLGYGFGDSSLIQMLHRVRPPFNTAAPAIAAGRAALLDQDFVARSVSMTVEGRRQLAEACAQLGLGVLPSQGNFVCIDLAPAGADAETAFRVLNEQGVTIRNLESFGLPKHIRVTIGTREQNLLVIAGLKRLCKGTAR